MKLETPFDRLYEEVKEIVAGAGDGDGPLEEVVQLLRREVEHYDWVGFYLAEPGDEELTLGPFAGEPTEHTVIDYGEGICGQAAEAEETFAVEDVDEESNYLACSPEVRSEIVVPVFEEGLLRGEIDIDSHQTGAFGPKDRRFLEELSDLLAPFL